MKVLGKKSLSTLIKIFLWILFTVCLIVVILGGVILIKDFTFFNASRFVLTKPNVVLHLVWQCISIVCIL